MPAPFISVVAGNQTPYFGLVFPSGQIPSGQPGSTLEAYLVGMRSNFGFNSEPHTFELDFIPYGEGYGHGASGNLPAVNTEIEMRISGFYLKGTITHCDWNTSIGGTVLNIGLKDKRETLSQYKITTEDMGDSVPSGVISVSREYRLMYGVTLPVSRTWPSRSITKTEIESNDPNFLEYRRIIERGATYPQIVAAINNSVGPSIANKLPEPFKIAPNIGSDINSLRFQFNMSPLGDVLDTITLDTAFEWYWNMETEAVSLINKKAPFSIPEEKILRIINGFGQSGIQNVKSIGYGFDKITQPTKVVLMGARQEGIMNSPLLSPIDGLDTIYDGSAGSGTLVFEAAWPMLKVGFYDADGFYRTYTPTDIELQMALKDIETWTYFKKYQSNSTTPTTSTVYGTSALNGNYNYATVINQSTQDLLNDSTLVQTSGWGLPQDAGSIAAQHPDFQSRLDPRLSLADATTNPEQNLRVINNRRDLESNWVIEFYNRVLQHAQRHYGKSYVATNALTRNDKVFELVNEAWCNVENQRQNPSQPFTDDYEISRTYGPISPFFNTQNGKVSPFCVLPQGTVYGPLGEDSPASFSSWTEDAPPFNPNGNGQHYIPVQLGVVGQRVIDPRNTEEFSFESFPENTVWCQLPEIAGSGLEEDQILKSLATTTEEALAYSEGGMSLIDLVNPAKLIKPYTYLTGVALPVVSNTRYGISYPQAWTSGQSDPIRGDDIIIDEDLAPWIDFPEGTNTSVQKLTIRAFDKINATISEQNTSQYVSISQVGLPGISFDTFSIQTENSDGLYGQREHGVNEVSMSFGMNGLETTYKAQSYYQTAKKASPLADRTRARLEGIITPIDYTDLSDFLDRNAVKDEPNNQQNRALRGGGQRVNYDFERQEACTVISISNVFDAQALKRYKNGEDVPTDERYFVEINRKTKYMYKLTGYTINPGNNVIGHSLNSLNVKVNVLPYDSSLGINRFRDILAKEIDESSVQIFNATQTKFECTIIISNREGTIRPTQETIRRGFDITDYGVTCIDGFLNIGDKCVYVHKRAGDEEIAYLTGGRKYSSGSIIIIKGKDDETGAYDAKFYNDPHGRYTTNIRSLNNVDIPLNSTAKLEGNSGGAIKPGPNQ